MPLFLIYYFHRLTLTRVHFKYSNFAWGLHGGVDVMWMEACLILICIDVILVRVKVSRGFEPFSPWGSIVRTLVHRPMGRFAWTNHIYFQITQPGSSTVTLTPLYQ